MVTRLSPRPRDRAQDYKEFAEGGAATLGRGYSRLTFCQQRFLHDRLRSRMRERGAIHAGKTRRWSVGPEGVWDLDTVWGPLPTQRERLPPARNAPAHSAPPLEPETAAFCSDALHVNLGQLKHAHVGLLPESEHCRPRWSFSTAPGPPGCSPPASLLHLWALPPPAPQPRAPWDLPRWSPGSWTHPSVSEAC